ncbi:SRPBCC family protein [Nocardia sp. 004]|uniref:SRPBCC family protein n=1 Tax=Nocardia sp. 004 TaxID=3385978 RepID=UPI0039A37F5E
MLSTDPTTSAGLVIREVRTGARNGVPTKIAIAQRDYPTDRADLWEALTDIERIPRWFLPISGELQVGGRYQFEGNAGGVIEQCDAPQRLAMTWERGAQMSWLTIELTATDEGTLLELRHEAPVDPELWSQYGPGAVGVGWDLALLGLALHLSSGTQVDPAETLTFPATAEGRAFIQATALAWAEAAIGAGDDPAAAHMAATQTIGFYTIAPEDDPQS